MPIFTTIEVQQTDARFRVPFFFMIMGSRDTKKVLLCPPIPENRDKCEPLKRRTLMADGMSFRGCLSGDGDIFSKSVENQDALSVRIRTATHFSSENSHRETLHRGRIFRSPRAFVALSSRIRRRGWILLITVLQTASLRSSRSYSPMPNLRSPYAADGSLQILPQLCRTYS